MALLLARFDGDRLTVASAGMLPAYVHRSRTKTIEEVVDTVVARVLSIMGLIAVGFLLFLLLTSNPFARLLPAAREGQDLNPLLRLE